jgi:hypothetical protein
MQFDQLKRREFITLLGGAAGCIRREMPDVMCCQSIAVWRQ